MCTEPRFGALRARLLGPVAWTQWVAIWEADSMERAVLRGKGLIIKRWPGLSRIYLSREELTVLGSCQ